MESSVGIEILPGKPLDVFFHSQENSSYLVEGAGSHNKPNAISGLLFDDEYAPSIVVDPAHYQRSAIVEYQFQQENRTVQMDDPVDHGEGWIRIGITRLS